MCLKTYFRPKGQNIDLCFWHSRKQIVLVRFLLAYRYPFDVSYGQLKVPKADVMSIFGVIARLIKAYTRDFSKIKLCIFFQKEIALK